MTGEALDVFISYSHRDEALKDELINYHLKLLLREGKINTWQDRNIEGGAEWAKEIKTNLEKADIVLLLITRHFLASDYCYEKEMRDALQRHQQGAARVIPIILKPCSWKYSPFSQLQVLPQDGKPVTRWEDQEEAFVDVEEGIRRVVDALNTERQHQAEAIRLQRDEEHRRQQEAERLRQQREAAERQQAEAERQAQEEQQRLLADSLGISPSAVSSVKFQSVKLNQTGNVIERHQGQGRTFCEDLGNNVSLDMVKIPAGEFVMGSPPEEACRYDREGPQRTVTMPRFFLGQFQVTQAQYEAVMGENPSLFKGANRPVEQVSWKDTVAFCEKLSGLTGRTYRLPSEAEWEYACRAGTTTPFNFGPTITTDLANYDGNRIYGSGQEGRYRQETTDVGSFPPNAFGLYDMHGNVFEWCQDVWHDSYEGAPSDGSAWVVRGDQDLRVLRGGSWVSDPADCRSAFRGRDAPGNTVNYVGFRVVCGGART